MYPPIVFLLIISESLFVEKVQSILNLENEKITSK